ncbi:MAG: ribosome-binding factor A [Gemmataceae bacterium]|nr:ribosome-binding factor A [Gemmataceae bacterium]
MAKRRFAHKPPDGLCAHWGGDDGIDPRLTPHRPQGKVNNRKALQLCRQIERILAGVLEGDLLRDLCVQAVTPAPDSSRLLATFTFHGPEKIATPDILDALHNAQAKLRAEVALGIHRRKTPELVFRVLRA